MKTPTENSSKNNPANREQLSSKHTSLLQLMYKCRLQDM